MTERTCGTCVACCTYLEIKSPVLDKPGMSHCPHLRIPDTTNGHLLMGVETEHNCKVHGTDKRPDCCGGYKCGWLLGGGEEEDRPDRSLILIDITSTRNIGNAIEAKPLADGQQDTPHGRSTIIRMSSHFKMPAIVLNFREKRIVRLEGRGVE